MICNGASLDDSSGAFADKEAVLVLDEVGRQSDACMRPGCLVATRSCGIDLVARDSFSDKGDATS